MQIVIKDNRKKVNRKAVTFKCRLKRVLSKRKVEKSLLPRGSANVSVAKLEGIQIKNKQLADALNKAKIQISIMQNQIRDTRDQNLDLRVENATQRDEIRRLKASSDVSLVQRQAELDIQQKLQAYLEPMRKSLNQALEHTEGLTNNLTQTMQLATALDRKSKSIQSSPVPTPHQRASPGKQPTADSSSDVTTYSRRPASSVAQILPMVKGHPISQPKIKMSRVLMSTEEIESLQRQHSSRRVEVEVEGTSNTNSEDDEEEEEVASRQQHQRQLRLRNLDNRPIANLSDLVEEEEEDEDDSDEEGRRVTPRLVLESVLIPRLVLDRVTVPEGSARSPHKRRRTSPVKMRRKRSRASMDGAAAATADDLFNLSSPCDVMSPGDVMSPRVVIRDDAHELMSKINNNSSTCDTEAEEQNAASAVNLSNPYRGGPEWNLPSTPDESGVDVNLDEEETSSTTSGASSTPSAGCKGSSEEDQALLTPGGSRETRTEFLERVMSLDPMEGPSWLYDDNNKKRRAPPRAKKTKTVSSESKTSQKEAVEPRTITTRRSGGDSTSSLVSQTTVEQAAEATEGQTATGGQADAAAAVGHTSSGDQLPTAAAELPSRPSDEDDSRRGGRRRAAAAALGSLKEPAANKKLRQGDPSSSSIYSDFVPGTKTHAGTTNRRTASMGGSQSAAAAAKRQGLHKKRSK